MHTKILCALLVFWLFSSSVFAATKWKTDSPARWILEYNFQIQAEYKDGQVIVNWTPYRDRENFKWYKFAFSTSNPRPVYSQDTNYFIGDDVLAARYTYWPKTDDFVYVNICAVTVDDTIYCDWGRKVMLWRHSQTGTKYAAEEKKYIDTKNTKQESEKQTEKKQDVHKKVDTKKEYTQWKIETKKQEAKQVIEVRKTETQVRLSPNIQRRADILVNGLIHHLDTLNVSTEEKMKRIEQILERLKTLSSQLRFRQLSLYIIGKLEIYRDELDSGISEIEKIFRELQ